MWGPRARALLQRFNLTVAGRRPVKYYSKGMKRKLAIAVGIIHQPEILFLDDPTTGIDVAGIPLRSGKSGTRVPSTRLIWVALMIRWSSYVERA